MKLTTETATPVVSAPIFRAQTGEANKLKAMVQKKRRGYLNESDLVRTIFVENKKTKQRKKKVRIIEVCEAWFCLKALIYRMKRERAMRRVQYSESEQMKSHRVGYSRKEERVVCRWFVL